MTIRICFDMDGTIADLYNVPNWLKRLESCEKGLYLSTPPLVDMELLNHYCEELKKLNYEIGIISWLATNVPREYNLQIEYEKRKWLEQFFPTVDFISILGYGVNKRYGVPKGKAYLIDDSSEVLQQWETPKERKGIQSEFMFEFLEDLLQA